MEGLNGLTPVARASMASPRWPSARLASIRPAVRDQREVSSRSQCGHSIIAAAGQHHFATVPLPATLKVAGCRQPAVMTANVAEQPAFLSYTSGGPFRSLIHTSDAHGNSLELFLRDPLAWLVRLLWRLQSMFAQLFTESQKSSFAKQAASGTTHQGAASACDSVMASSKRIPAAAAAPVTRRCTSGRYVPPTATGRESSQTQTRLVATQAAPMASGQRSFMPIAALAITAAAALACTGYWMSQRWRTAMEGQKETQQRIAVKKDSLARQKQRFQRALVVDSVNLELPPIKDMDVQPGPVRVEQILQSSPQPPASSSNNAQRGNVMPGLGGEGLRQWQQFMSASRAKDVTNVSDHLRGGGGRGAVEPPSDRPYIALDDRMLADLSERIRRANDVSAAGGAAQPIPVITFEQLYANNQESDEEAMARRAAERKARWQKQQPAEGGAGARNGAAPRAVPVEKKEPVVAPTVSKARPKALDASNPFAVGLFPNAGAVPALSSVDAGSPCTSRISSVSAGVQAQEPQPLPTYRVEPGSSASGTAGWAASRNRPAETSAQPALGFAELAAASNRSDSDGSSAVHRAPEPALDDEDMRNVESPEHSDTSARVAVPVAEEMRACTSVAEDSEACASDARQLLIEYDAVGNRQTSPCTLREVDTMLPQHQQDELAASPSRLKRAPAAGPLRMPETHAPALARLMRRPTAGSAVADMYKSRAVSPDLQLSDAVQ